MNGTILAHTDGSVPNLMVHIPKQDEYYLGQLFYFFEFACGVSGYILGVNPFNQPGVESYKKNMFALLGKPGFEKKGRTAEAVVENMEDYKMDFEALQLKESCRVYSEKPVPRDVLTHLVDVARMSPSGCNAQPWRFIIVDEPGPREKLIEAFDDDGLTGCPWGDRVPQFHCYL